MNSCFEGVPFHCRASAMSECDEEAKAIPDAAPATSACDPTPEQLKFLLSKISGNYEAAVRRVHEIRKE